MHQSKIFFVNGESGSGKTTLLSRIAREECLPGASYHFFDSISIPPREVMERDFGSPDRWQEDATQRWIDRLITVPESVVIVEGSTRPQFIMAAYRRANVRHGGVLLLDCGYEERQRRLCMDRAEPELANLQMFTWAAYLRGQADALGLPVLDTTDIEEAEACAALLENIKRFVSLSGTEG